MARPELQALYGELLRNQFGFIPRESHSLDEIYHQVHASFTHQCDDSYVMRMRRASSVVGTCFRGGRRAEH